MNRWRHTRHVAASVYETKTHTTSRLRMQAQTLAKVLDLPRVRGMVTLLWTDAG